MTTIESTSENMSSVVLVTGATGLLGRQVFNTFKHSGCFVVGQGYSRANPPTILKADLENKDDIQRILDEVNIVKYLTARTDTHVLGAANRSPDLCEQDPEKARRVNVEATRILAEEASSRGAFLIYISTDYVFPGTEGEAPYVADAETNPPNLYGQLKRDGELVVLEATKETGLGLVLRVPVLYGPSENNSESAVNCLIDAVWKSQVPESSVKMDDWAQRYPTNTEDVARVCRDIVIKYIKERTRLPQQPHILQFSSEDRMTKYEICKTFAEVLGLPLDRMIRNKQGNDPNGVQRPYDTHLSTQGLKDLGIDVRTTDFVAWW
ncbi:hypothetical protein APSETT444_002071 [Aspergillus pseudonomiae]